MTSMVAGTLKQTVCNTNNQLNSKNLHCYNTKCCHHISNVQLCAATGSHSLTLKTGIRIIFSGNLTK